MNRTRSKKGLENVTERHWKEPEFGIWEYLDAILADERHRKYHQQKKLVWRRALPRTPQKHPERQGLRKAVNEDRKAIAHNAIQLLRKVILRKSENF